MKKITFLLFSIMVAFSVFSKPYIFENSDFSLKISIEKNITIKKAKLLGSDGTEIDYDSSSHSFSGNLNLYGTFTLLVTYRQKDPAQEGSFAIPLFLQEGKTELRFIKIPDQYLVSGSSEENFKKYKTLLEKDHVAFEKVRKSQSQLDAAIKKNNTSLIAKLKQNVVERENERKNIYLNFIQDNPRSIASVYAVNMYGSINIDNPLEIEKAVHLLDDTLQKSELVIALSQKVEIYKKIMVGQLAPEIAQADTSGKIISLGDLKGQYVLIDFWASWCKPCRAENPSLVSLYNKFKDKDFTILSVSLDSYKKAWIKAITDDHLEWLQISDLKGWKNEAAAVYNIFSVPQNYLLDKNGIIIAKNLKSEELSKKLFEVIDQKK